MSSLDNTYNDPTSEISLNSVRNLKKTLQRLWLSRSYSCTRCPSCKKKAVKFSCASCITNMNLVHSVKGTVMSCKFHSFRKALEKVKLLENHGRYFEEKQKVLRLSDSINKVKENISEAKKLLKIYKEEKTNLSSSLELENAVTKAQEKKMRMFEERINKFYILIEKTEKEKEAKRSAREEQEKFLKLQVQRKVSQTLEIFPVNLFLPSNVQCGNRVNARKIMAYIEDAANTSYVRGEWEFPQEHDNETLVAGVFNQLLPADGNYLEFFFNNKDSNDNKYNISIGLTYLVQVVNLIAYFTGVILPRPMQILNFNHFEGNDFKSPEFHKHIYNMNANIFHLCLSQGVPAKYLHPQRAIPNIIALMYNPDSSLGRFNPIIDLDNSANEYLDKLEVPHFIDSDDDENDDKIELGWEKLTTTT